MRRSIRILAAAALAWLGACADAPTTAPTATADAAARPAAAATRTDARGRYIVVFEDRVARPGDEAREMVRAHGGTLHFTYEHALRGFAATLSPQAAEALRRNPNVRYVEADQVVKAAATQTGAPWGLDRIDQRYLPLSGGYTYQSGATGQGVNAYVVDSGIRFSHTQFGGRAVPAADFVAEAVSLNGNDCTGHGTHVAGILGGSTYGVAKGVKLHSVRVISCYNEAFMSAVVAGLEWVRVNHVKPAVVNMGFIGLYSLAQDDAVKTLLTAGVTVVSPAGNFNNDVCFYSSAYIDGVITAGATDANDARWPDSNWGYCIDVFAPGANIVSAAYYDDTDWTMLSGTSMAAPHVAGAVARYLQTRPTATPAETHAYIVNGATTGVVTDPGHLSPNRLLYVDPTLGGTPPSVTISGFSTISAAGTFTWQTSVTGGTGSYAYAWEYRVQGGAWTAAGTGSTYSRSVAAGDPAFELRVTVTSGSASASDNHLVAVNIPVPVAVSANITGPDYMMQGEFGTWYANASGGNGSYTYQWRYRLTSSTTWTNVGTGGSYYSRSAPLRSFYVGVTVTSGTSSVYSEYLVFVEQTTTTCGGTGTTMTYKCLEPMEPVPIN